MYQNIWVRHSGQQTADHCMNHKSHWARPEASPFSSSFEKYLKGVFSGFASLLSHWRCSGWLTFRTVGRTKPPEIKDGPRKRSNVCLWKRIVLYIPKITQCWGVQVWFQRQSFRGSNQAEVCELQEPSGAGYLGSALRHHFSHISNRAEISSLGFHFRPLESQKLSSHWCLFVDLLGVRFDGFLSWKRGEDALKCLAATICWVGVKLGYLETWDLSSLDARHDTSAAPRARNSHRCYQRSFLFSRCPKIVVLSNPHLKPRQMHQEPCGWAEHDLNWDGINLKKDDFCHQKQRFNHLK